MNNVITSPSVALIMGSQSDWETMKFSEETLLTLKIPFVTKIISAHRTPERMTDFSKNAEKNNFKVIIAGAGGAAHLPGMLASKTELPILGVPIPTKHLDGNDSLLSIVQMPKGVPVATFAIGEAGASNSALFAISMLSIENKDLEIKLLEFRKSQTNAVLEKKLK